jgi:hypothetical protein
MKMVCDEPRPMTALPLVRRGGEWVDLELPRGHVAEPLLRKARVIELQQIYTEQAALLEKLHARDGRDVFVATYRASRDAKSDAHDSYSVWSKGVATLLPRTERIVFFDDDQPDKKKVVADVDWPIVALHCASQMKEEGLVPPRYLVESFPTPAQLEAMRRAQATRAAA